MDRRGHNSERTATRLARRKHNASALTGALALCAIGFSFGFAAGCSSAPPPVSLSSNWPASPNSGARATSDNNYFSVVQRWTRRGSITDKFDKIVDVRATFLSPRWRAAYVARRNQNEKLSADARESLLAEQRKAAAGYHEVELLVATYEGRENNLHRGERSVWRLSLIDDQGRTAAPIYLKRDRRPKGVVQRYFPDMGGFYQAYVVRFPLEVAVLRPDARRFTLRMSSAHGAVDLIWSANN